MTKVTNFSIDADGHDGTLSVAVSIVRPPVGTVRHLGFSPDARDVPEDVREALAKWLDSAEAK